ncbi:hypothetical protein QC762_306390 [Podospora pseudocomata]|uniref:Uncharacterized protein n=1 Tax=Podospora pseudocomata TaxID=2093779 RepID=A0ABR0GJF5_9PEZI|nr:hypothetical protein QC762_306390 [Podospora pseudocomata]
MPPPNTPEEGLLPPQSEPSRIASILATATPPPVDSAPEQAPSPEAAATTTTTTHTVVPSSPEDPALLEIDYQILEYLDAVDETLLCPVCKTPFHEPITTSCGHTFCAWCINRALDIQPTCPIDRQPLTKTRDYHRPPLIIKDQLDRLKVKCPNKGCDHICPREHLDSHYERRCEHTMVRCPDARCRKRIARRHVQGPASTCMHREVSCRYCDERVALVDLNTHYDFLCSGATTKCSACEATVVLHRMEKHCAEDCLETQVRCKWHIAGCKVDDKRYLVQEHETGCPYEIIGELLKQRAEDRRIIDNLTDRLVALETERREHQERRARRRELSRQAPNTSHGADAIDLSAPDPSTFFYDMEWRPDLSNVGAGENRSWGSPEDYMLARFERLESRMEDLSKQVVELDAHQSMSMLQQIMPLNQQLVELGSKVGVLNMHTTWLMNMQRHNHLQQRAGAVSSSGSGMGNSGMASMSQMSSANDINNNFPVRLTEGGLPYRTTASRRNSDGRGEPPPRL